MKSLARRILERFFNEAEGDEEELLSDGKKNARFLYRKNGEIWRMRDGYSRRLITSDRILKNEKDKLRKDGFKIIKKRSPVSD